MPTIVGANTVAVLAQIFGTPPVWATGEQLDPPRRRTPDEAAKIEEFRARKRERLKARGLAR